MGHNSLLEIFQERLNYDYLVPIDGDDIFYPSAFHQLQKALLFKPTCLCIQTNDSIARGPQVSRHALLEDGWKLLSWFDDQENWWKSYRLRNPFLESLDQCATPARPVIMHRSVLGYLPRKPYGEDFRLFDDLILFLNLCEAYYRRPNEFNLLFISNTYIYLHNDINPSSMTHSNVDYGSEQAFLKLLTNSGFENVKFWRLEELPYCQISNPDWFFTVDKIQFCNDEVKKIDLVED
jgi:hypothetical protein